MTNKIAEDLIAGMRQSVRPGVLKLRNFVQGRPAARKLMAEVKSVESLVADGRHPLHAAYSSAQNYLSVFSELASPLREFKDFTRVVGDAEEAYMPGWPPMSPVSVTFFTSWALLDQPVAATGETICSCAVEIGRAFGMSADFASTLAAMGKSATGIYQHLGWQDGLVGLRDILDDQVYRCIVPSGYRGAKGELWYVRLLPPLTEAFAHGVAFTSPYVLRGTTEKDWRAFFERQELGLARLGTPEETAVRRKALFKRGPDPNYWNEYVFLAYSSASDNAIELYGIPDHPETLPHGDRRRR
jgi:hypothetical protein